MMPDLLPSDISLFEGLSAQAIAAVALIYFVAFSIRGVIGFGSGMPAVLFSSWILDPHHAVLSALTTGAAAQVQLMPTGIRHGDWQVARPLMIAVALAIVFGIWIFGALPAAWLTLVLGLVMSVIVLMDLGRFLSRFAEPIDVRAPGVAAGLAGTSGLIAAGTGFFGALSDARFYRIFQVILLLMAMGLVWKGSVAVL